MIFGLHGLCALKLQSMAFFDESCSSYLLFRCSEFYDTVISFAPKPIKGDWNGAGCHANFSTKGTREKDGFTVNNRNNRRYFPC